MNEESVEPANPESINIIGKPNRVVIFVFGCAGGGRAGGAAPRPRQVLPSRLLLFSGFCSQLLFYSEGHFCLSLLDLSSPFFRAKWERLEKIQRLHLESKAGIWN